MSERLEARLSRDEVVHDYPPIPYLTWDEGAVKAWLREKGFDLSKEIQRRDDLSTGDIIFRQDN